MSSTTLTRSTERRSPQDWAARIAVPVEPVAPPDRGSIGAALSLLVTSSWGGRRGVLVSFEQPVHAIRRDRGAGRWGVCERAACGQIVLVDATRIADEPFVGGFDLGGLEYRLAEVLGADAGTHVVLHHPHALTRQVPRALDLRRALDALEDCLRARDVQTTVLH